MLWHTSHVTIRHLTWGGATDRQADPNSSGHVILKMVETIPLLSTEGARINHQNGSSSWV